MGNRTSGRLQTMPKAGTVRFTSRPRAGKPMVKSSYPAFTGNFSRGSGARAKGVSVGRLAAKGRFGRSAGRVSSTKLMQKKGSFTPNNWSRGSVSVTDAASSARRNTG